MKTRRQVLACGVLAWMLTGCASNRPKQAAVPPATTQEGCAQVMGFFAKHEAPLSAPIDTSAGCHFRVTAPSNLNRSLGKQLTASGWKGDPAYDKSSVRFTWEAPATHCAFEKTEVRKSVNPVHGSVGVSGGTHITPGFGVGINIGSPVETTFDYKIDCFPTGR
jgi:hypothetical protein